MTEDEATRRFYHLLWPHAATVLRVTTLNDCGGIVQNIHTIHQYAYLVLSAPNPVGLDGELMARTCEAWARGVEYNYPSYPTEGCTYGPTHIVDCSAQYCHFYRGDFGQFRKWNKMGSISGTEPNVRIRCGQADISVQPAYPTCPPELYPNGCEGGCGSANVIEGYRTLNKVGIVKWDVPGGLKYRTTTLGVPNP